MLKDVVIANKSCAKITVSDEKFLDEIAVKVVRQENPEFLLPVKIVNINGETEIRYELGDGLRLKYLNETMTKKDFLLLLENMICPFNICNDWFLDYHKFHLDTEYIVVGKNNSDIRYIYRFDDNYIQSEDDILEFFEEFIYSITLNDDENYKWKLFSALKDKSVSLQSFMEKIIKENSGMQESIVVEKIEKSEKEKKIPVDFGGIKEEISNGLEKIKEEIKKEEKKEEKEIQKTSEVFGKEDVKGNLINHLFAEEEEEPKKKKKIEKKKKEKVVKEDIGEEKSKKSFLSGLWGTKKEKANKAEEKNTKEAVERQDVFAGQKAQSNQKNPISMQPSYEPDYTEDDATVIGGVEVRESSMEQLVLELEDDRGFGCPKYIEIDLRKGYATIGRYDKSGVAQADYNFEAALSFISRRHCRIERRNDQLVVIDLGSGNGTVVNDIALTPNMPMNIHRGDKIIFSKNKRITYRVC